MQDPAQADKLAKIQQDLDETKIILHKTIESVLDRGEKLDQVGHVCVHYVIARLAVVARLHLRLYCDRVCAAC